jgi:superfamily II DNA or RNA helicase
MKKSILTHRGLELRKSELPEDKLAYIKEKLSVKPFLGDFADETEGFEVFTETKKTITVPRYWGLKKFGQPAKICFTGETRKFNFNSQLRDYQIDITNTCYDKIKTDGGGLLSVGCGRGKTVMGIYLAHKLEAFTLIVVHKTFLLEQWIERIKQFTDARIGVIRQDKIDIEDKDIVIAMIQSLSMREYDMDIFNKFKFVIYDEAHHCASKVFSKALYKTGANYTLALTATPDRTDGLKKVMDWYLGPVLYREFRQPNKQVLSYVFKYNTKDKLFVEKTIYKAGQQKAHTPTMINNLVDLQERNTHLINIINQIRQFPERKILILSGRIAHLEFLKKKTDELIKKDIEEGKLEEGEIKTCYYIGKLKEKERREAELYADILFASYDMAHEGLDIDRLNTVILSTPKKSIIQSVGRVMRRVLQKGDRRPIIIDFADELSVFKRQSEKRIGDYNDNHYKVKVYYINKDKLLSNEDYLKNIKKFDDDELKNILKPEDKIVPTLENILNDANDENKVCEESDEEKEDDDNDKKNDTETSSHDSGKKKKTKRNTNLDKSVKEVSGFGDYLF